MVNEDRIVESRKLAKALESRKEVQSFSTGFGLLDNMVRGAREGDLWIVSGLTGAGKSQLMVSMARNMESLHPLFFSYEMPAPELLERFGENMTSFYLPLLTTSGYPSWIEKKIIEAKTKYGTRVVFIDHLHYLIDPNTASNRNSSEIIGALVRQLRQVARRNNVIMILACHVRRINSKGQRPTLNDLRDSSNIANESDVVLILHRMGDKRGRKEETHESSDVVISNDAILYVDKCRHFGGRLGKIRLMFDENGFYKEAE